MIRARFFALALALLLGAVTSLPVATAAGPTLSGVLRVTPVSGEAGTTVTITGRVAPTKKHLVVLQRKISGSFRSLGSRRTDARGRFTFSTDLPFGGATAVTYRVLSPKQSGQTKAYVTPAKRVVITTPPVPEDPAVTGGIQRVTGHSFAAADRPVISGDGSTVVFASDADDLAPGDQNGLIDLFSWSRATGAVTRLPLTNPSRLHAVSATGAVVASTNGSGGLTVWDATSSTSTVILPGGFGPSVPTGLDPAVSGDGRYVAFSGGSIPGEATPTRDIYRWDSNDPESLGTRLVDGNGHSDDASISADGSRIAFRSLATNLVPGDPVEPADGTLIYLWQGGAVTRAPGTDGDDPAISADGSTVAFSSTGGLRVWNVATGVVTTVPGTAGDDSASRPTVSSDGRYVVFESESTALVPGEEADANEDFDLFGWDRSTGSVTRLTYGNDGFGAGSFDPSMSGDGRYVAFQSGSAHGTADSNGVADVFLWDRLGAP